VLLFSLTEPLNLAPAVQPALPQPVPQPIARN
jgi:hypothetical protein